MPFTSDQRKRRVFICFILVLAIVFSWTGHMERVFGLLGLDAVSESNDDFLKSTFRRSLELFGVLSALKIGLSVVEGTEVGVGFGLSVGRIVKAVNDYVHIAWKTVLVGSIILLGTQYLLQATGLLDQWVLVVTLLLSISTFLIHWFLPGFHKIRRSLRDIGTVTAFIACALYLILPLSIWGGALLSNTITKPSLEAAESRLTQMKEEMFSESQTEDTGFESILSKPKENIERFIGYLKAKTRELAILVFRIIAAYVFDCLVFPLALLIFLIWSTKAAAQYFLSSWQAQSFKEDLVEAIAYQMEEKRKDNAAGQ